VLVTIFAWRGSPLRTGRQRAKALNQVLAVELGDDVRLDEFGGCVGATLLDQGSRSKASPIPDDR
jgi:hypothetical protein